MLKLIHETKVNGSYTVELWRTGKTLEVRYGRPANTKSGLTYTEAAKEYGAAIWFAIQCATDALDGIE